MIQPNTIYKWRRRQYLKFHNLFLMTLHLYFVREKSFLGEGGLPPPTIEWDPPPFLMVCVVGGGGHNHILHRCTGIKRPSLSCQHLTSKQYCYLLNFIAIYSLSPVHTILYEYITVYDSYSTSQAYIILLLEQLESKFSPRSFHLFYLSLKVIYHYKCFRFCHGPTVFVFILFIPLGTQSYMTTTQATNFNFIVRCYYQSIIIIL